MCVWFICLIKGVFYALSYLYLIIFYNNNIIYMYIVCLILELVV